jgi:hypothetical protein
VSCWGVWVVATRHLGLWLGGVLPRSEPYPEGLGCVGMLPLARQPPTFARLLAGRHSRGRATGVVDLCASRGRCACLRCSWLNVMALQQAVAFQHVLRSVRRRTAGCHDCSRVCGCVAPGCAYACGVRVLFRCFAVLPDAVRSSSACDSFRGQECAANGMCNHSQGLLSATAAWHRLSM